MSPGRRGKPGPPAEPTFLVRPTRDGDQRIRAADTPRSVRAAYADKYTALQTRGCAAADYRLSGAGAWPRFCVIDLGAGYKLVLAFQDEQTVVLVHLDQHDQRTDPYAWLEEAFGLPDRSGHGGVLRWRPEGSALSRMPARNDEAPASGQRRQPGRSRRPLPRGCLTRPRVPGPAWSRPSSPGLPAPSVWCPRRSRHHARSGAAAEVATTTAENAGSHTRSAPHLRL